MCLGDASENNICAAGRSKRPVSPLRDAPRASGDVAAADWTGARGAPVASRSAGARRGRVSDARGMDFDRDRRGDLRSDADRTARSRERRTGGLRGDVPAEGHLDAAGGLAADGHVEEDDGVGHRERWGEKTRGSVEGPGKVTGGAGGRRFNFPAAALGAGT